MGIACASTLYIVASPIGNLEDISFRALNILKQVNTIFCEDTRVSQKLLKHYEIHGKKLISFNKDNEGKKLGQVISFLDAGKDLALLSDAGTPLISDPGLALVQAVQSSEHRLVTIPGASALTAALSLSPIDTSGFIFEGFLPHGPKQRRRVLKKLEEETTRPLVIYESPHRIKKTLKDIVSIFGEHTRIFLLRELTKKFEQSYFGSVFEVLQELEEQFADKVQGEIVFVMQKAFKTSS